MGLDDVVWPGDVCVTIGHDNPAYEVRAEPRGSGHFDLLSRIIDAVISGRVRDWVDDANPARVLTVLELETDAGGFAQHVYARNVFRAGRLARKVPLRQYEPYM